MWLVGRAIVRPPGSRIEGLATIDFSLPGIKAIENIGRSAKDLEIRSRHTSAQSLVVIGSVLQLD